MYIPFVTLPAHARIWIYQSNRNLTTSETLSVQDFLQKSVESWEAHGCSLEGSVAIFYHRFIVIAVNEAYHSPSGCSIDASVRWLGIIENQLNISLFDRSLAFLTSENHIETIALPTIKQAIVQEIIVANTIVFNNLVCTVEQFENQWKIPASKSWMKRYFEKDLV